MGDISRPARKSMATMSINVPLSGGLATCEEGGCNQSNGVQHSLLISAKSWLGAWMIFSWFVKLNDKQVARLSSPGLIKMKLLLPR